jgi:hypothetical protein
MIRHLLKQSIRKHKDMILEEAGQINGFMKLLMKPRNTGAGWTKQEKAQLRKHLKRLSFYVPVLIIFLAPFGSLLIPVLAEILDRRKNRRTVP